MRLTLDVDLDYMAASGIARYTLSDETLDCPIATRVSREQLMDRFDEYLDDLSKVQLRCDMHRNYDVANADDQPGGDRDTAAANTDA